VTALALVVALVASPCTQNTAEPSCVAVPTSEAAIALQCVSADLPECERLRVLDAERCEVDKVEIAGALDSAEQRADELSRLLDEAPLPPAVPWYAKPEFVAPAAVAVTLLAVRYL
jgi:hypothetical protein